MAVRKTGQAAPAGGTKGASWDGKGRPPSWEAAYEWAEARGFSRDWLDIHLGPVVNGDPDDKTRPAANNAKALYQLGELIRKNVENPRRVWVGQQNEPLPDYDKTRIRLADEPTHGTRAPVTFRLDQDQANRGYYRAGPKPERVSTTFPLREKRGWRGRQATSMATNVADQLEYWHDKIRMLKGLEERIATSQTNKERGWDSEATQRDLAAIVADRKEAEGKINALDSKQYVGAEDREKKPAATAGEGEAGDGKTDVYGATPPRLGPGDDSFLWPAGLETGSTSDETKVDNQRRGYLSKTWMDGQVEAWRKENPGAELPDTLAFYEDKKRFDPEDTRIKARYRTSDLGMWERWDSNMIASMQKDFEAIGLYKAVGGKYNLGDWRGKESTFFAILLAEANMEGLDWQEMLAEWKKNPPSVILDDLSVGSGGGRTPNPIQITNPDDIRSEARTASKSLTGQMRPGFDESMVGGFQGSEIAAGQALNTEGVAGTGGVVTASATPGAYAEAQLRANSGPEVGAYSTLGAFNAILQELGLAG